MIEALDRRFPKLAFARHVPPSRIATRMARRLRTKLGLAGAKLEVAAELNAPGALPPTLFEARAIKASRDSDTWKFTFLNETRSFAGPIDWRPDAAQLWRMNLHYFEYLEVMPFDDGLAAIEQWIEAYPSSRPGAFADGWNAYALSLRAVCWMQWLARHDRELEPSRRAAIGVSLAQQLDWLARFPETDLGGNHLVKNIKALFWGAASFTGASPRGWRSVAKELLEAELKRQVLSDGVHFERAPAYHNQVTADLIEIRHVAPDAMSATIVSKMVAAAATMSHPDGKPAQFGDTGLSMAYGAEELALAAGMSAAASGARNLPDAGMAALHAEPLTTFVKFGAPGARSLPAHAHADIGSFELSAWGERCIVDQGVYEYVGGERRRRSRAAGSHNLSAPESGEPAAFFGEFRCGWWPEPEVCQAQASDEQLLIDVEHDGFAVMAAGPSIRRRLSATANCLEVVDRLSLPAPTGWAARLLVHPGWTVVPDEQGALLKQENHVLRLETRAPLRLEDAVWWPDMGCERRTKRIVLRWGPGKRELAFRLATGN